MLENCQRLAVTDIGVVIPKAWFAAAKEVELREEEGGRIVLSPVLPVSQEGMAPFDSDDPIWEWGKDPVDTGLTDASVNVDKYAYGDPHGMRE